MAAICLRELPVRPVQVRAIFTTAKSSAGKRSLRSRSDQQPLAQIERGFPLITNCSAKSPSAFTFTVAAGSWTRSSEHARQVFGQFGAPFNTAFSQFATHQREHLGNHIPELRINRPGDTSEVSAGARTRSITRRRSFKCSYSSGCSGRVLTARSGTLCGGTQRPPEAFSSKIRLQSAEGKLAREPVRSI
jgi:hypothetical protein